jgi:hypothetical protein
MCGGSPGRAWTDLANTATTATTKTTTIATTKLTTTTAGGTNEARNAKITTAVATMIPRFARHAGLVC